VENLTEWQVVSGHPEIHLRTEAAFMHDLPLSAEQEAQAQAIFQRLRERFEAEALQLARLMASKDDAHLLGDTEFQVRDRVHGLGAQVLQVALDERKKGGTKAPAAVAHTAKKRRAASVTGKRRSRH
jgi:hypothetical protein